jgi:hypothetical protein
VLVKLFADRQLAVEAGVVEYVATRIERSLERAVATVAELDREALSGADAFPASSQPMSLPAGRMPATALIPDHRLSR